MEFDPDAFLASKAAPAPTAAGNDFDPDKFLSTQVDPVTGDTRPKYADGLSPDTPLNKSPVDVGDRFNLALGNQEGNLKFLKAKFQDAKVDKFGKTIVKQDGLWHRVDAEGTGDGNPYERTKELLSDAAEAVPNMIKGAIWGGTAGATAGATAGTVALPIVGTVAGGTAGAIGGAIAGAGMSVLADAFGDDVSKFIEDHGKALGVTAGTLATVGLATKGIKAIAKENAPAIIGNALAEAGRTSLGRLVGTYEGDAVQQVKDIGFEALLNLGGATIGAGVSPTANVIGKALEKTAPVFEKASAAGKNMIANVIGTSSQMGYSPVMTILEDGPYVGQQTKRLGAGAANSEQVIKNASSEAIKTFEGIAEKVPAARSLLWKRMTNEIKTLAPETMESNTDDLVRMAYMDGAEKGLLQFVKEVPDSANIDAKIAGKLATKNMVVDPKEIAEYAAKGGRALPEGVSLRIRPHAEIVNEMNTGVRQLAPEFANADSHEYYNKFIRGLRQFQNIKNVKGPEAAEQLLGFKKYVSDLGYTLTEQAKDESMPAIAAAIKDSETKITGRLASKFTKADGSNPFLERNKFWENTSEDLSAVLKTISQAKKTNSSEPYEKLLKAVTNRNGASNVSKKEGFEASIEVLKQAGMDMTQNLRHLRALDAVKSAAPWVSGTSKNALYLAGGSAASGHALPAVGALAVAGAASPKLNSTAIRAAQTTAAAGLKGMSFLRQRTPDELKMLVQNPNIMGAFFNTIAQTPEVEQQLRDQLVHHAVQSSMPQITNLQSADKKAQ